MWHSVLRIDSQKGYALWLQLPKSIKGLEMYHYARQQQINIVPGEVFGEGQRYSNFIRINTGHELSDEIRQAMICLADWTKAQLQQRSQQLSRQVSA